MTNQDFLEIYEALLYQQKLLLDVKIQVESLKSMMFEHRPAFVDAFSQQINKIQESAPIQKFQGQIAELEANLQRMR